MQTILYKGTIIPKISDTKVGQMQQTPDHSIRNGSGLVLS